MSSALDSHADHLSQVMPVFAIEVPASSLADLDYATVEAKVKKSMGANYDGQGTMAGKK